MLNGLEEEANLRLHLEKDVESQVGSGLHEAVLNEPSHGNGFIQPELRHVRESLSWETMAMLAFLILQYGAMNSLPTDNFLVFPLPRGGNGAGAPPKGTQESAGALGLGVENYNIISNTCGFVQILLIPLYTWLADCKIGRFNTLLLFIFVSCTYSSLYLVSSIPSVLRAGHAVVSFVLGAALQNMAGSNIPMTLRTLVLLTQFHSNI